MGQREHRILGKVRLLDKGILPCRNVDFGLVRRSIAASSTMAYPAVVPFVIGRFGGLNTVMSSRSCDGCYVKQRQASQISLDFSALSGERNGSSTVKATRSEHGYHKSGTFNETDTRHGPQKVAYFQRKAVTANIDCWTLLYNDKSYEFIEDELRSSYHPQSVFCYAIDYKAKKEFAEKIGALAKCLPNVNYDVVIKTVYETVNILRALAGANDVHSVSYLRISFKFNSPRN
ncbi:hypothetical protein TELCIR_04419 [Teladorsagia circumcincta]|uniref:Uncharacterized protein n=1 Tax=Teladorsagia circumcincta TaxID=45464 RepID=A0A2G9UTN1_TELCI|nr:hypothetical protein TELCIR_04419 [Teladorsagia circumcincta]